MNKIKQFFADIYDSIKSGDGGFSLKKEHSIVILIMLGYLHFNASDAIKMTLIYTDSALITAILGISAIHQYSDKKIENDDKG
jgi:hypothetical protein